ncbi:hypothetical protein [Mesonia sp. HuA40]|uniref:hypothetical protein n=1 Tax=Mesonia sp. HuA40 TaxID=2602761 RepID=UPI0011CCD5A4|nr:hypothetical protein [Mesonia sp. HuA40]TXK72654.1 hypothetical protein FT993_07440 [Mesonia sp. HuA40]
MQQDTLEFKQINLLILGLLILVGGLLLLLGLLGYVLSDSIIYLYIIILGNLLLITSFFLMRLREHQVLYDPIFIRFKLRNYEKQKIKITDIKSAYLQDDELVLLLNLEKKHFFLTSYPKEDRVALIDLIKALIAQAD